MESYTETLKYLYEQLPMFQRSGSKALKKDLTNITLLCEGLGNPHHELKFIHVAGTNGKGTVSHLVGACLQALDLRIGLYTSPHYQDFRERIKINGKLIPQNYVIKWVSDFRKSFHDFQPSFFELSVALAFSYFQDSNVDIIVLETGLGGRLDSTNIVNPLLSAITNISLDHQSILGDTIYQIAKEKAGIIKRNTPVVIGRYQHECDEVFISTAHKLKSSISWASRNWKQTKNGNGTYIFRSQGSDVIVNLPRSESPFIGENIMTTLEVIQVYCNNYNLIWHTDKIALGLSNYRTMTNFSGRWQILSQEPLCIADSAHNVDALYKVVECLSEIAFDKLHLVLGFVKGKNLQQILKLFPHNASFYFVRAQIPRAMSINAIEKIASMEKLSFTTYQSVAEGIEVAYKNADGNDLIFIGGSSFVVGEAIGHS